MQRNRFLALALLTSHTGDVIKQLYMCTSYTHHVRTLYISPSRDKFISLRTAPACTPTVQAISDFSRMSTRTSSALAVLLLVVALAATRASAAVQCGQVTQLMAPCMPYLAGAPGMTPYGLCCNSLGVLNQLAATTADRVATCNCVKAAAGGFPAVDFGRAAGLPAACGLSISFTISPNMDCNQYVPLPFLNSMHACFYHASCSSNHQLGTTDLFLFDRFLRRRRLNSELQRNHEIWRTSYRSSSCAFRI